MCNRRDRGRYVSHANRPVTAALLALRERDPSVTCLLRIVQYVGDDPVGPGFAIEPETVASLAALGASMDVDQYLDPA